jgi:hypothetical protein
MRGVVAATPRIVSDATPSLGRRLLVSPNDTLSPLAGQHCIKNGLQARDTM